MGDDGLPVRHRHFAALDGLRGVAAYAVLIVHLAIPFEIPVVPHGYLAVDFFFILSGLVVARAYEDRLKQSLSFTEFARIRLVRLYPLVMIGALGGAAVFFCKAYLEKDIAYASVAWALLLSLVMIPVRNGFMSGSNEAYPLNMPQWSLFYELVINFLYAALVCRLSIRVLSIIIAWAAVALVAAGAMYGDLDQGFQLMQAPGGIARVVFSFSAGLLAFRMCAAENGNFPFSISGYMVAAALIASFMVPTMRMDWLYDCACVIFIFPLVILFGIHARLSSISTRIALFLGQISYPLYIIHYPMATISRHFLRFHHFGIMKIYAILLVETLVVTLTAYIVMRFFDLPLRAWLTARFISARRVLSVPVNPPDGAA